MNLYSRPLQLANTSFCMQGYCCPLSFCDSRHPTAHFETVRSCFTSSHSALLLRTFLCPSLCLLASFITLHLYYALNNSLCIESCVCSFCFQSPKGVSLEALLAGRTCFFVRVLHPSLCFLLFLCFPEIPLLSLL